VISKEGPLTMIEIPVKQGCKLIDAVSQVLEPLGIRGAGIRFEGLKLAPVNYVMPTYASDDQHAAYYSETYTVPEGIHIDYAHATYGIRENIPSMHFHGLWKDGDKQKGGHILPAQSIVAEDAVAMAYCTRSVEINSVYDPETNFTIYNPLQLKAEASDRRKCIVATVKANEDLLEAIASICKEHGVTDATLWTAIGSTVGGDFQDGRIIEEIPTELIALNGKVWTDQGGKIQVDFDTALIDAAGTIHFGRLRRGENPVLILFELVIAANE
jgi:predicted DNA-binding protein with PD1-like motif